MAVALKVGAKKTYLTHLSHQLEKYEDLKKLIVEEVSRQSEAAGLPVPDDAAERILPAYDGLEVEF